MDLLRAVASFDPVDDVETDTAFFRTHVPWVAPDAYLHIIHKPAPQQVLQACAIRLRIPDTFVQFLAVQNGAHLFSGALYIFGVHARGQLLDRTNPFLLPPFNIEWSNRELTELDRGRFLAVGGYGFDGAIACLDRTNGRTVVVRRDSGAPSLHGVISTIGSPARSVA